MAEFVWAESEGAQFEAGARLASTRFGDGYEQIAPDGLNPITQRWDLSFKGLDATTGDEIIAFLGERVSPVLGLEPFDWTPPWATVPLRVVCRSARRTQAGAYGFSDIACTFEQWHQA